MKAAMLNQGRNKSTRSAVYVLRAQINVSLLSWVKGELEGQEGIILPNNLHEVDAKERKKEERGEEREKRRVMSRFLGFSRSWCQLAGWMELPLPCLTLVKGTTR
jgi:hypothetical protein